MSEIKKRGLLMNLSFEMLAPPPPGRVESTDLSPEWLAERAAFVARWAAMQKEGLDQGFIEYEHCFECAGTVEPTTNTEVTHWLAAK